MKEVFNLSEGMSQEEIDKLLGNTTSVEDDDVVNSEESEGNNGGEMSQEEIDKLMNQEDEEQSGENLEKSQVEMMEEENRKLKEEALTKEEKDVIGEVGNIAFGSSATSLSNLLNKRVTITTPRVDVLEPEQLEDGDIPHVVLNIKFAEGLEMENLLIIKNKVAKSISSLMLGSDGVIEEEEPDLSEMELSAVQEAMNQMMGGAATSLSELIKEPIDISPPTIKVVGLEEEVQKLNDEEDKSKVVRISFELEVEGLIKSNLYQMITIENAKKMASKLLGEDEEENSIENEVTDSESVKKEEQDDTGDGGTSNGHGLGEHLGSVGVIIEVRFGSNYMSLEKILSMKNGELIELKERTDEPMGIFANGIQIGEGEIVNVEGNFGVEIKDVF